MYVEKYHLGKHEVKNDAMGLIEVFSIAQGYFIADSMVKKANVNLIEIEPICSGKFLVIIDGDVESVSESMKEGLENASGFIVDSLFLPYISPKVTKAIRGSEGGKKGENDSIAVVETINVAATILSADASVKAAEVEFLDIRLANGIGGKAFYLLSGDLNDVEASVEAAKGVQGDNILNSIIIQNPHLDFLKYIWVDRVSKMIFQV